MARSYVVLQGPRAGWTGLLNGRWHFMNGRWPVPEPVADRMTEIGILETYYAGKFVVESDDADEVHPSPEQREVAGPVPGDAEPEDGSAAEEAPGDGGPGDVDAASEGDDGQVPDGDGGELSPEDQLIFDAISLLDPHNEGHWNRYGKPSTDVVSAFVGHTIKRSELEAKFPHLDRDFFLGRE